MPLESPPPVDTRAMFRPVSGSLVGLLRRLPPEDWLQPTVAGAWLVRDVVAHLIDSTLRRLSFHRDGMTPPPPPGPVSSDRGFVAFINGLNAQWVDAARRLSPRVLTDMYEHASVEVADWFESQALDAPALFAVSWAGEQASANWFDIGREFTELWHHQQQIRMAVRADSLPEARYLRAVIDIAVRGLPHAYRNVSAEPGQTVVLDVSGPAGGQWTLVRESDRWTLAQGEPASETTRVRLGDDAAWKLLFNALPDKDVAQAVNVSGRAELASALLRARSVIV
jgi:uncharacterized protein (TIGR03083 family)